MAVKNKFWQKLVDLERKLASLEKFLREEAVLLTKKQDLNRNCPLPGEYILDLENKEIKKKKNDIYHFYF